jgi:hypothetical protein
MHSCAVELGQLGFIPGTKQRKQLVSLFQVTRAWQRPQIGKQDQGNGQGHRSPESASVALWVTAERHMGIDAAFCILVLQQACFAICSRTPRFSETKLLF